MLIETRPWLWLKIFLISFLFVICNLLFYWGLFFQATENQVLIAPSIDFKEEPALLISAISKEEKKAQKNQLLFIGDEIKTLPGQFAEIHMGKNTLRLGPKTHIQFLNLNFNPLPGYDSQVPTMQIKMNSGQLWVNAFNPTVIHLPHYEANLSHSMAFLSYEEGLNTLVTFSGVSSIRLKDETQKPLTQFVLPLLKKSTFLDTQINSDIASLKLSKLKKEFKISSIDSSMLSDPWVSFYLSDSTAADANLQLRPIYSDLNYWLHHLGNFMGRVLSFDQNKRDEIWLKKANYTVRYWLGAVVTDEKGKALNRVQHDWLKIQEKTPNQDIFREKFNVLFFQLPWGNLGSAEFALKEALFNLVLSAEGPIALRDLIAQMQLAFSSHELGKAQRFMENWLTYWKQQNIQENLNELMIQFEMLEQLGLYYPEAISSSWLSFLDQAAQLLLKYMAGDEEFELALTENRLAQVGALIRVYRYDFAKDYLRSSYQNLPIAEAQELSSSEEVFFELGKLLAQRIEYAELTFGGAALPIDEQEFALFVLQNKQSDLLSNDLVAFLEAEEPTKETPSSVLPSLQEAVETLQVEGLVLNETNISLSKEDPLAFQLNGVLFKDLDGVERKFDALYFPLNRSFSEMVVEKQAIPGIFKFADLTKALSLPALMAIQKEQELDSKNVSDLFGPSASSLSKDQASQELARQLAFNQLNQAGFYLSAPKMIELVDKNDLERVRIVEAGLKDANLKGLALTFEFDTSKKILYQVQDVLTQETYFDQIALQEGVSALTELFYKNKLRQEALAQFNLALKDQPVVVEQSSLRFLNENTLQATQVTLKDLNLSFNALFDVSKNEFTSLNHPLYSANQVSVEQYIPLLVQAYVDDFLKKNQLPIEGALNIQSPFNRLQVNNYEVNGNKFTFVLDLEKEVFTDVQLKGVQAVTRELSVDQFRQLIQAPVKGFES